MNKNKTENQTENQTENPNTSIVIGGVGFEVNPHGCIANVADAVKAAHALVDSGLLPTLNGKDSPKTRWVRAMLSRETLALWQSAKRTNGFTLSQNGNTYTLANVASSTTAFDRREPFTVKAAQ